MGTQLPLLMQNLFNTPIALSQRKAEMIVAALAGKLDISHLTGETATYDRAALAALSERGRMEAQLDRQMRAARSAMPDGPFYADDWYGDRPYKLSANGVAIIEVLGTLTRTWGTNPESGTTGYDGIWTKLAFAIDDTACQAIWLRINSGGGAVDGLMDLARGIYRCSARFGGKPIWAFAGDYAHSAAYMLGAAADQFFAPELGGVGSVGCLAIYADISQALEQDGIKAIVFRHPDRKAIGAAGLGLDEEAIEEIQDQIVEASTVFQSRVAEYRGLPLSRVSETRGRDYTATKAAAIGFIDGIMSEQDAWMELGRSLAR